MSSIIFLSDSLGPGWRLSLCFCSPQLRHEKDLNSHYAYYEVSKTNYKYLNLPENRCSDKDTYLDGPSVTECVEGFIENHLKCRDPIQYKLFSLSFSLKNGLRFLFDSVTCVNY